MNNRFSNKKVLILGLGINQGGLGATRFFAKIGAEVRVTDLKTAEELQPSLDELKEFTEIEYSLGGHRYEDIDWADIIIKNPALKKGNVYVEYAKEKGKQIEMDMGIFLQFVSPKQVIGITGTKGKSTTASLIYQVLKESHSLFPDVVFAGNIGKSVLDILPYITDTTLVVLELSSFQLDAWGQHHLSPKWAVVTNIFPDHLNYYSTMEEYIKAKRLIAQNQTSDDSLFIRRDDPITTSPEFIDNLSGQVNFFSAEDLPSDFHPILQGGHNLLNMAAALKVTQVLGVKKEDALEVMKKFKGVEFRMQMVKEWNNVTFYNDTTATNPHSAAMALQSFPNAVLIAGGQNAGLPYKEFAETIDRCAKSVYFLEGDATDEIKRLMDQKEKDKGTFNNFFDLLTALKSSLSAADIVLFSPGAKSFNLFQNEFDRGRKFNETIDRLYT